MKALVAYGSGRGTTAKIAAAVVEGLTEAGADAAAVSVEYLTAARIASADVLGVGTPVHFYRETRYIRSFLEALPPLDGKRAFVFCTCGMDRPGETLPRVGKALSERGAAVVGARSFRSAMSYYPHRKRGLGNPDALPDAGVLDSARLYGAEMARCGGLPACVFPPVPWTTALKARLLASERFRRLVFPGVRLNRQACTGYGSCLSRCLVQGLDRLDDESIPYFTASCARCLECIAWCPRGAIEVDSGTKEWLSTLSYRLGIH